MHLKLPGNKTFQISPPPNQGAEVATKGVESLSLIFTNTIEHHYLSDLLIKTQCNAMTTSHFTILPFLLLPVPSAIPAPHIYKIHFLSFNANIMLKARCEQSAEFSSQAIRVPHSSWTVPKNSTCFVGFLYGPSSPI